MSTIKWGPYSVEDRYATGHFLFLGATGSGKTVLIKMLMKSVFGRKEWDGNSRALVYDAKRDFLPQAQSLGIENRVVILNPFDVRGYAWDIAADITSPIVARQMASVLVPESSNSSGSDQFFTEAVREICTVVLNELVRCRGADWTFRDFLLTVLFPDALRNFLKKSELLMAQRICRMYLDADPRTVANIISTLGAKLGVYEPIAAAWDQRRKNGTESIRSWIKSDRILVLGNDEGARTSLDAVNRAIFQRVTEEVLNLKETRDGRTWIVLDEVREAGYLDGLRRLMNKGRSKGACVVLGCQDVDGMKAVYGQEEGGEILGQCNHVVILNLVSPDTAEWASRLFGEAYIEVRDSSVSMGTSYSEGENRKEELRSIVTTDELLNMRRIHPKTGLSGYYRSPALLESERTRHWTPRQRIAPWLHSSSSETFSWEKGVLPFLPEELPNTSNMWLEFEESDDPSEQLLKGWTAQESMKMLGSSPFDDSSSFVAKAYRERTSHGAEPTESAPPDHLQEFGVASAEQTAELLDSLGLDGGVLEP